MNPGENWVQGRKAFGKKPGQFLENGEIKDWHICHMFTLELKGINFNEPSCSNTITKPTNIA